LRIPPPPRMQKQSWSVGGEVTPRCGRQGVVPRDARPAAVGSTCAVARPRAQARTKIRNTRGRDTDDGDRSGVTNVRGAAVTLIGLLGGGFRAVFRPPGRNRRRGGNTDVPIAQEEPPNERLRKESLEEVREEREVQEEEEREAREKAREEARAQEEARAKERARAAEQARAKQEEHRLKEEARRKAAEARRTVGDPRFALVRTAATVHTPFEFLDDYGDLDPYDVLNVPFMASREQIRSAYMQTCRTEHPDRHGGYESVRWQLARWAYEQLNDTETATAYVTKRVLRSAVSFTGNVFYSAMSVVREFVILVSDFTMPILQAITNVFPSLPQAAPMVVLPPVDAPRNEAIDVRARDPLFNVEVLITAGMPPVVLAFFEGEDPREVAATFAKRHNLSVASHDRLQNLLAQQVESLKD